MLGLRRAEVSGLDLGDLAGAQLEVRGKGDKTAQITLPAQTRAALDSYLELRGREGGPLLRATDPGAARRGTGGRLSPASVYRIVRRRAAAAGVKAWPHGLRHTAITAALDASGGDLRAAQRYSRHADPRTLMLYDDNRADLGAPLAAAVASRLTDA